MKVSMIICDDGKYCALALALISEISDIVVGAFALFAGNYPG